MSVAMIGPKFSAWDKNGKPLAFGKLYTYQARTNAPKATYQSEDQVVENTNPVILNGEGYANVYLDGAYKMVLKDDKDNEIWSSDPVTSASAEEWINCFSATYVGPTSFKIGGNQTDSYSQGRKVRIDNGTTEYSYTSIVNSSYASGETSVVVLDSVIETGITGACTSIVSEKSGFSNSDIGKLSGYVSTNVEDMISGKTVGGYVVEHEEGQVWKTKGYYESDDGGMAVYFVTSDPLDHEGINHQSTNGLTLTFIPENSEIRMNQAGVKYDSATIQKIKPISDYANDKLLNVELTNESTSQVYFDDEFHLLDTRLSSKLASYLYYKKPEVIVIPDELPVLRFGNNIEDAHPAYFDSELPFRIGEALRFDPSQGYGEVLYQCDGKVYYKWARPSGQSEVPPTVGTVTGSISGSVQAYSSVNLGDRVYGTNRNAGFDRVYLRTDELVNSHTQAAGLLVNGVRGGRRFGELGSFTSEGFQTAGLWLLNYFMHVTGTIETSKCADGHIFSEDNNDVLMEKYIGSAGTDYDSVDRWRGYIGFSSGFHINNIDCEFKRGVSKFCVSGCKSFTLDQFYSERDDEDPMMLIRGGAFLDGIDESIQNNQLFKCAWSSGLEIGNYYALDAYCIEVGSCIDGLDIGVISLTRQSGTPVPSTWDTIMRVSGTNINKVKIGTVVSNDPSFDVTRKFKIDMTLPQSTINFHESNYKVRDFTFSRVKPSGVTQLKNRLPMSGNTFYYVDGAAMFLDGEASIDTRVRFVTSEGGLQSIDVDNATGDWGYGAGDPESVQNAINYIDIQAWDLPAAEVDITYTATIRELKIN